jgi:hypothetical protein
LLRSLAIKVQEFEVNRLNDIRVANVLNDICLLGKELKRRFMKISETRRIYVYLMKTRNI